MFKCSFPRQPSSFPPSGQYWFSKWEIKTFRFLISSVYLILHLMFQEPPWGWLWDDMLEWKPKLKKKNFLYICWSNIHNINIWSTAATCYLGSILVKVCKARTQNIYDSFDLYNDHLYNFPVCETCKKASVGLLCVLISNVYCVGGC